MKDSKGLLYTNVNIRFDRAYVLFVGDVKYIDTTTLLSERLSKRYGKRLETINILPNMPSPYMSGNFIVVNTTLADYISRDGDGKYFLPLDQPDINRDVSNSPYVRKIVQEILRNQKDLFINLFKSTPEMTLPEEDERIHVIGPNPNLFSYFDNKVNQRSIAEKLDIPVPRGYVANTFNELIRIYKYHFNGEVYVTRSNGFGGNGSEKIHSLDDLVNSAKLKGHNQFVVSDLFELYSSPCSLGLIANSDEIIVASIADQLMHGVDYGGTVYPSDASVDNLRRIGEYTKKIGQYMGKQGYRGFFGLDFMIDKKGNLYFVEINPRKIGSTPEAILAHRTLNPHSISLPELEFLAVTEGTFRIDSSLYTMPDSYWGVKGVKAKEGQRTLNYIPRESREKAIFKDSGVTILDHPGSDVTYLADGRLARVVCVVKTHLEENPREKIIRKLEEESQRIKVA